MPVLRRQPLAALALATFLGLAAGAPAHAAAHDNNVEWAGVSHVQWQDLRPRCPVNNESFAVRFQTWHNDITSARVLVTTYNPTVTTPDTASMVGTRGPYDIWQAQVPALTVAPFTEPKESYVIELTDGNDTDYYGPDGMSNDLPASGFPVNFYYYDHAPAGATLTDNGGAVFKVWSPSPTKTSAYVVGDFNGWNVNAGNNLLFKFTGSEYLAGRIAGPIPAGSEYKFVFPNPTPESGIWRPDPRARALDSGNQYNSIVENPDSYDWQIADFDTPELAKMVVYQLHVGTFSGRNDPVVSGHFPGRYLDVAAHADHLADLGVNAVMLNPITEFPTDISAGYNPITEWSPESAYGSPDDFKTMVDALHAHGIAVLLDIVWNHFSGSDNFLWYYDGTQQYYDLPPDTVETPWGRQAAFDTLGVRDYFLNSALYWLEEYKVDGFRMDGTDYMNISYHSASGWSLMQDFNNEVDNRWVDKVTIAEQLPDDDYVTRPTSIGGAGFDSQYYDAYTDDVRQAIFDAAFGNPSMSTVASRIQGGGTYLSGTKVLNYIELHDEAWPSSGGQRMVKTIDPTAPHDDEFAQGRMKLGLGLTMFAPGVPAMLMGDEWLEDTDFGADQANQIDWSKLTTYAPYYDYIRRIIHMRTSMDAFRADRYLSVFHVNDSYANGENNNVIAFFRTDAQGNHFVVVANFGNFDYPNYRIGVPQAGDWKEIVNSQSAAYGGDGLDNPGTLTADNIAYDGLGQSLNIKLAKMALIVLGPASLVDVAGRPAAPSRTGIELVTPVPARDGAEIDFTLAAPGRASLDVLDVAGRRIARIAAGTFQAGRHTLHWDGRDETGRAVNAGLYFVMLKTDAGTSTRRLPVVR